MKNRTIGLWLILIILLSGIGYVAYKIFGSESYNVRFDTNGGSEVASIRVLKDEFIENVPKSVKNGYQFDGWYLNNEKFNFEEPIEEDVTLVAKWILDNEEKLVLTFDTLGGNEIPNMEVDRGTVIEAPIPIKNGYQFDGWFYHNKKYDFEVPIKMNMTLIAKWRKNE